MFNALEEQIVRNHPVHPVPTQWERCKPPWLLEDLGRTEGLWDLRPHQGALLHWFTPEAGRREVFSNRCWVSWDCPTHTSAQDWTKLFGLTTHITEQTGIWGSHEEEKIWLWDTDVTLSQGLALWGGSNIAEWRLLKQRNKSSPILMAATKLQITCLMHTESPHKSPLTLQNSSIIRWKQWRLRAVVMDKRNLDPRLHLTEPWSPSSNQNFICVFKPSSMSTWAHLLLKFHSLE